MWTVGRWGGGADKGSEEPASTSRVAGCPRRQPPQRSASFDRLGPLDTPIPISTGTAEISTETDGSVLLQVNGVPSSHLHPDPEHLVFEYMR